MEFSSAFAIKKAVERAVLDVKVSLLGDASVGKTSIAHSFHGRPIDADNRSTICFELSSKIVSYPNGDKVRYVIYDTAGQERYRGVMPNLIRHMDAVVIVYDITNQESFRNVRKWLQFVEDYLPHNVPIIIVGNKIDQSNRRVISLKLGEREATSCGCFFVETSALTGQRVHSIFERLSRALIEKKVNELFRGIQFPSQQDVSIRLSPDTVQRQVQQKPSSSCC